MCHFCSCSCFLIRIYLPKDNFINISVCVCMSVLCAYMHVCVYNVTSFPAVPGASECLLSAILMSSLKGHSRDNSSSKWVGESGSFFKSSR